ncbi:MAG: hypothetical protein FWG56_10795 [Desulfovibrionaceae bacterium]|jgi:hypothetical protein|nr:hypothetical protein [Desulfovibrionaceae bacterium]
MPEQLRLIALTGRAGAGKDSVAATLVRHLNYRSIAFADALRAEIAQAWRIDARMLQDPAAKELDIPTLAIGNCCDTEFMWHAAEFECDLTRPNSPRWIMQRWGDFQKQRHGRDYYAATVAHWIKRQIGAGWRRLVVTDMRFVLELESLRRMSDRLRTVRVLRPGQGIATASQHASETELIGVATHSGLLNDGTLQDLVNATLRMEASLWTDGKVAA